jgi:hypothetical protein
VRLHLAIADRDRFLLTSIGVRCPDDGQARDLLATFMREFKPEQVKRYLMREVIAGLPNASALDLSQFAGLFDADPATDATDYRELLGRAARQRAGRDRRGLPGERRWALVRARRREPDRPPRRAAGADTRRRRSPACAASSTSRTRAAGAAWCCSRSSPAALRSIGKGEGCDIRVDGTVHEPPPRRAVARGRRLVGERSRARPTACASKPVGGTCQRCGAGAGRSLPLLLLRRRAQRAGRRRTEGAAERLPDA